MILSNLENEIRWLKDMRRENKNKKIDLLMRIDGKMIELMDIED